MAYKTGQFIGRLENQVRSLVLPAQGEDGKPHPLTSSRVYTKELNGQEALFIHPAFTVADPEGGQGATRTRWMEPIIVENYAQYHGDFNRNMIQAWGKGVVGGIEHVSARGGGVTAKPTMTGEDAFLQHSANAFRGALQEPGGLQHNYVQNMLRELQPYRSFTENFTGMPAIVQQREINSLRVSVDSNIGGRSKARQFINSWAERWGMGRGVDENGNFQGNEFSNIMQPMLNGPGMIQGANGSVDWWDKKAMLTDPKLSGREKLQARARVYESGRQTVGIGNLGDFQVYRARSMGQFDPATAGTAIASTGLGNAVFSPSSVAKRYETFKPGMMLADLRFGNQTTGSGSIDIATANGKTLTAGAAGYHNRQLSNFRVSLGTDFNTQESLSDLMNRYNALPAAQRTLGKTPMLDSQTSLGSMIQHFDSDTSPEMRERLEQAAPLFGRVYAAVTGQNVPFDLRGGATRVRYDEQAQYVATGFKGMSAIKAGVMQHPGVTPGLDKSNLDIALPSEVVKNGRAAGLMVLGGTYAADSPISKKAQRYLRKQVGSLNELFDLPQDRVESLLDKVHSMSPVDEAGNPMFNILGTMAPEYQAKAAGMSLSTSEKIARYSPQLASKMMGQANRNWLTYAAMKNQGGALDITGHLPQGGLDFKNGSGPEVIEDFLKGVGEKMGIENIHSKMLTIRGNTTSATLLPFRQMAEDDTALGAHWRGMFGGPTDAKIAGYQDELSGMDTESFRESLQKTTGVTAYTERYFASDTVAAGRVNLDPRTARKMAENMEMPYEDFAAKLKGEGVRGSAHRWPFHNEISSVTYGLDEQAQHPMVSREFQLEHLGDGDADPANFILHGRYDKEAGEYRDFAGAKEFENRALGAKSAALSTLMAMGGERSFNNYLGKATGDLGRAPSQDEILFGYQKGGKRQSAYNPDIKGFASKTQNVYEESMQDANLSFFGRLSKQIKTVLSPTDRAVARIDEADKKMQMGLIHQQTVMQAGLMMNQEAVNKAFPHVGSGLRDYLHSQGESITDLTPARVISQGLARLYQTPLDLQAVSHKLHKELSDFSYNYQKPADYQGLMEAFEGQESGGKKAFTSEEMGALFGSTPESMQGIAKVYDEVRNSGLGKFAAWNRITQDYGGQLGDSAVGQMMTSSRAYHINEQIANGTLRHRGDGSYEDEKGNIIKASVARAARSARNDPMYGLTAQLIGDKPNRPIEEYVGALQNHPLLSGGIEKRMIKAGVGDVSPDETQSILASGQATLFPLGEAPMGPQNAPASAPVSALGDAGQMSMDFAHASVSAAPAAPSSVPTPAGGLGGHGGGSGGGHGAPPMEPPEPPMADWGGSVHHPAGGSSPSGSHASRKQYASQGGDGAAAFEGGRHANMSITDQMDYLVKAFADRQAIGIGKALQANMFPNQESAENFYQAYGELVKPNANGGYNVDTGDIFQNMQGSLSDQGSNFFTQMQRFESGQMTATSERQSFSNLAKRAARGMEKMPDNEEGFNNLWAIHKRAEGMIDKGQYSKFAGSLQKDQNTKAVGELEKIASAIAGTGDARLADAAKALTKAMKNVTGIMDEFGKSGEELTSTMDKSRDLISAIDSGAGDLQKTISGMAAVAGKNPDAKAALGIARSVLGNARGALTESGAVGSMVEETHGPGAFAAAMKEAKEGPSGDRLFRTMLGFQMLRGVRMAFNPLEQAAAAFDQNTQANNAVMGMSGQGINRGSTALGRSQMGIEAIQEGFGRNASRVISGAVSPLGAGGNGNLIGTLGTALLPAAGAAFAVASLAPALQWTKATSEARMGGAALAVGAGSILAGAFGAAQDPASMAISGDQIGDTGGLFNQDYLRRSWAELGRDPLSAMGRSLSSNSLWQLIPGMADYQNKKAAERAPYEAALARLKPGLLDPSKAPVVSNMTGIEANMFSRSAFETDTPWSRMMISKGFTAQGAESLSFAQMSRTAQGQQLDFETMGRLADMPAVQMGDYSIMGQADQYAQLQGSTSAFGGLSYIKRGMNAKQFEQGNISSQTLGGADAARSLMYNGVTSNVESFRKQYLSEDGTVTPYNERRAAATTFASEFYGASGRKRSITASSENFGKMAASQNMSPDRALSALSGYARRSGNFDPYAAADYMGDKFDLRFLERQGSNYEAMGGVQGEAFFNKAGFRIGEGGGFSQISSGAYINPMAGEVMQGIAGGDPYYASRAMDAGMINIPGGGPTMDTTTGAPLFRRTMYGLPNGAGGYYQKPTANQIGSYFSSVLPGRTDGRSTGLGAYAGHLNNVMAGNVYSGMGGQLALQMEGAVVNRDAQLASAGIQVAQAKAGHQYSVNVEQPFAWTQQELGYAAQVGGVVNTPYMQKKGIAPMDFGRGSFAISRAQMAIQEQDTTANYQQGQVRMGWQLQDIGIEQGRTNVRNSWQREDFAAQGAQRSLARGMQQYNFAFQERELGFQRQEINIGRREAGEDFTYNKGMRQLQFGWTMEDADTNIRRSTGFQRKQLVKERDRAVVLNNKEVEHDDVLKKRQDDVFNRQEATIKRQEEKLKKELDNYNKTEKIEQTQFEKQKKRFEQEAKWKDEDFGKQRGRITQELSWADESYKRSVAQIDLRKEQMTVEEQAAVTNHELAVARFDDDKKHEEEMYALNLASAGVAASAATKQFEISQRQLEMQLIEEKNQDALNKFIKDVKWEVFAKMVRDLISLTNGTGQVGGPSPDQRDENNSSTPPPPPPDNKDKYQIPSFYHGKAGESYVSPGAPKEDSKFIRDNNYDSGSQTIQVLLDSGVLVDAVVKKGASKVQIDTKRNLWRNN